MPSTKFPQNRNTFSRKFRKRFWVGILNTFFEKIETDFRGASIFFVEQQIETTISKSIPSETITTNQAHQQKHYTPHEKQKI